MKNLIIIIIIVIMVFSMSSCSLAQKEDFEAEIDELEDEIDDLNDEIDEFEDEIDDLNDTIDDLQIELDATPEPTPAPTLTPTPKPTAKPTPKTKPKDSSIDEQILIDQEDIIITVKGFQLDGYGGPEIEVFIENNSEINITVDAKNMTVNGYMHETFFSSDVSAGKKANDTITLSTTELELCGIVDICDIELSFSITDEDWDEIFDTEIMTIKTSLSESCEQVVNDSGEVLFEENGVKIVYQGLYEDSYFGTGYVLYLENNTEDTITVWARNTSVNGFMISPYFSYDIAPWKRAVSSLTFFEDDLEENNITEVNEIELNFHIFKTESWDTVVDTELITIAVK
ncbi:MAG: hypothetical protein KAQ68_02285 [Clostridiales bacterium]|nr:hypothetical protein [Clostridiales bacterium]